MENRKEIENEFEYLMMMFGNRMAQQRGLKERIIRDTNAYTVKKAREKLEEVEQEAGAIRDEVWALLVEERDREDVFIDEDKPNGTKISLFKRGIGFVIKVNDIVHCGIMYDFQEAVKKYDELRKSFTL